MVLLPSSVPCTAGALCHQPNWCALHVSCVQVLFWVSNVRGVQALQRLVEWMEQEPAVNLPGGLLLDDAKLVLDHIFTPPW